MNKNIVRYIGQKVIKMSICCFAGHNSDYNEKTRTDLYKECEKIITKNNCNEFWVGNYGGFDKLAAAVIRDLKKLYPFIQLNLILPYLTKEINDYPRYYYEKYDSLIMADIPLNTPHQYKIIKATQYMVKKSDFLICYIKYSFGGAIKTYEYAKKQKNIKIINIARKI